MHEIPGRYGSATLIAENAKKKVYKCLDTKGGNVVALKLWKSIEEDTRHNVLNQYNLLSKVESAFIIKAFDTGITEDRFPYLVTEWVNGGNLSGKSATYSLGEKTNVISQAAQALDFLHLLYYIHGDIKPSNILVSSNSTGELQIKLTDFEFLSPGSYVSPGNWQGTPGYMAPEVIRNEPLSYPADLYSLGILAYELLSGKLPFEEKDLYSLAYAQLDQVADFTDRKFTSLPLEICSLLLSLLAKNPAERPTVYQVRDILLNDPVRTSEADKRLGRSLAIFLVDFRLPSPYSFQTFSECLYLSFPGIGQKSGLSDYLWNQSGGNRELIKDYLWGLLEGKLIKRSDGIWSITDGFESFSLPFETAQKFIPCHKPHFSSNAASILESASIFNYGIERETLRRLVGTNPDQFSKGLEELLQTGWLTEQSGEASTSLRFQKGSDRDYVVQGIQPDGLKQLRLSALELLEAKQSESSTEYSLRELLQLSQSIADKNRINKYALSLCDETKAKGKKQEKLRYSQLALDHIGDNLDKRLGLLTYVGDLYLDLGFPRKARDYFSQFLSLRKELTVDGAVAERKLGWCYALGSDFAAAERHLLLAGQYLQDLNNTQEAVQCKLDLAAVKHLQRNYDECQKILSGCEALLVDSKISKEWAKLHNLQGILYWSLGRFEDSLNAYRKSLSIYEGLGYGREAGRVANNIALLLRDRGKSGEALGYMEKAMESASRLGDEAVICHCHNNLSIIYRNLQRVNEAIESVNQALRLSLKTSYKEGEALAHCNLGFILISTGALDLALHHLRQAVTLFKNLNDTSGQALAYYNIGEIYRIRGLKQLSLEAYTLSLGIRRHQSERLGVADNLAGLAKLYLENSEFDISEEHISEALAIYQELEKTDEARTLLLAKAEVAIQTNRIDEAQQLLAQGEGYLPEMRSNTFKTNQKFVQGLMDEIRGDVGSAEQDLTLAHRGAMADQDKSMQAKVTLRLGHLYIKTSRLNLASKYWRESLGLYQELKAPAKISELEALMSELKHMETQGLPHVQMLLQVSRLLAQLGDREEFLYQVLQLSMRLLGAERGAIISHNEATGEFEIQVTFGLEEETTRDALDISKRTVKEVQQAGKMFISENSQTDPLLRDHPSIRMHNILSIICVPLKIGDKVIGVLYLDNRSLTRAFSKDDQDAIEALANLISVAITQVENFGAAFEELHMLRQKTGTMYEFPNIIGKSEAVQEVFRLVTKVAPSMATVLIQGETGTGKELFAKLIHELSNRKDSPFVGVNCAAIPETLLESELFGIEERTATGVKSRDGKFKHADGGTIFLDEIADMTLSTQAKILRVLQERKFERLGGNKTIEVDVRIIAATNKNLERLIKENAFRLDLYYRLNTITIPLPPLRERKEDIPLLIERFIEKFSQENGKPKVKVTPPVLRILYEYPWDGNVRELMGVVHRGVVLSERGEFGLQQLPEYLRSQPLAALRPKQVGKLKDYVKKEEKRIITEVLTITKWNQSKAVHILDIPKSTLSRKIKEYGIKRPKSF